ncbi:hypothetical protein Tco_1273353 [Tanacetum coccineum]
MNPDSVDKNDPKHVQLQDEDIMYDIDLYFVSVVVITSKFDNGFISDLTTVRDNIILRVRILKAWMQPMHSKPKVINMELIRMDEQGAKMHATIRMYLVPMFKQQLNEDVIGQVIESPELDNYSGNDKQGKKKPLKLMDLDLLLRPYKEQSANTTSKISTASKFSKHKEFLTKYQFRNLDELIDLPKGKVSVIVATVILIQEEEGWWYLRSKKCNKKVVRGEEVLDIEDKDISASIKCTNCFFARHVTFRVQVLSQVATTTTIAAIATIFAITDGLNDVSVDGLRCFLHNFISLAEASSVSGLLSLKAMIYCDKERLKFEEEAECLIRQVRNVTLTIQSF